MPVQSILIVLFIGLVAGVLSGMLGIGGAVIIIPVLVFGLGFSQQTAQGTTLFMMVLPVGGLAAWQYYKNGFVDIRVALILAVAFFIGGYLGATVAVQIPQLLVKRIFAVFLMFIALRMLWGK